MPACRISPLVQLQQCSISRGGQLLIGHLSLTLMPGEHLAITGASGTGKTSLLQALLQRLPMAGHLHIATAAQPIAFVAQIHQFKNRRNTDELYYQQRYHAHDADDAMTAAEWIGYDRQQVLAAMPTIAPLLDKPLVQLSNGEHKKVQLARALAASPRL
nr:ATP-binding cassette domain-containing protein [Chitinophagaceae bacterium]